MMNINTIIKALSNTARWQILQWLKEPKQHFHGQKTDIDEYGVCSGLITKKLNMSQSTTSHYLKILEQCELVVSQRCGQWTYYKRNEKLIKKFKQHIQQVL